MATTNEVLSQEEIDALLHGVDSGKVDTKDEVSGKDGVVRSFDFVTQDRIVRGQLPTLEMINERFVRYLRLSLVNMMRRDVDVSVDGVRMLKFSDYAQSLFLPANLNMVRVKPLRGTALVVIDTKLVFAIVDGFFGGASRFHAKIEGREFTHTEIRVVRRVLDRVFVDLKEAWAPVLPLDFEYIKSEMNPQFSNIVSSNEIIVASVFRLEMDGVKGELHITFPYAMIEPIREILDADIQSDRTEQDENWASAIEEDIKNASVELSSVLTETTVCLRDLMDLSVGDVIPIEMPDSVTICAEQVPVFRGQVGEHGGQCAIKVAEKIKRRKRAGAEFSLWGGVTYE